jgi:hypothetical protein
MTPYDITPATEGDLRNGFIEADVVAADDPDGSR